MLSAFRPLERAIGISSLSFGLSHFTNMVWGGQDFAQTLAQVVSATAFGFLCCALMLFTGSIWYGVLLHGLGDFSIVTTSATQEAHNLVAPVNWGFVFFTATTYLLVAMGLMAHKVPGRIAPSW